jgi:hypothetical protein
MNKYQRERNADNVSLYKDLLLAKSDPSDSPSRWHHYRISTMHPHHLDAHPHLQISIDEGAWHDECWFGRV